LRLYSYGLKHQKQEDQIMNDSLSIGDRMAARKSEAQAKIGSMLWAEEPDLDAIAATALAGGVEPAAVDKMHTDAEAAKRTLAAAVEADGKTAGLEKRLSAARAKTAQATAAYESAQAALRDAEQEQSGIEADLHVTRESVATAARSMQAGTIPTDHAPAFLAELVAQWKADEARQRRVSRIATLQAQIRWLEGRVEGLQSELKSERADDPGRENKVASAGTLIPLQDAIAARLKTEREQLKAVKTELAQLEKAG
jgi:chromosome segregation ATPase